MVAQAKKYKMSSILGKIHTNIYIYIYIFSEAAKNLWNYGKPPKKSC